MRTVRHNAYIQTRKRRARYFAFFGFAILTSSLWIALNPSMILPAYAAMFVGFVLFNMGMQQVGKWSRNPRNDQMLDHQLNKLGDRYTLIHYPEIGKHKAEHVLVYPGGLLLITSREIDGKIENVSGRWRKRGGGFRRLFGFSGPQLGNPNLSTEEGLAEIENFLKEQQLEVDAEGIIVFLHPMVELEVEDPEYPVLHGEEVPAFVLALPADPTFTTAERDRLVELLSSGEEVQQQTPQTRRRPVKRRAA